MQTSVGRHLLRLRIAMDLLAAAKLLCSNEAGADQFAAAPGPEADADHGSAGREGETEHFGHRQRADIEADAACGNIDDEALDPWGIGRRNHKTRPPVLNAFVLALAEVFTVSRHAAPPSGYHTAKFLSGGYREKLTEALQEPGIADENGTGLVNANVKVTILTT